MPIEPLLVGECAFHVLLKPVGVFARGAPELGEARAIPFVAPGGRAMGQHVVNGFQLFGCGGNRARSRRYEMGEVSGRHADFTILTSDNPRYEDPEAILDDIEIGMKRTKGKYIRIADRRDAIAYAIHNGLPGDVIVLAGKGHEDYQEICGKKYPMDERVLIADILAEDAKKEN